MKLPTFLLIGANRAGTTTLYTHLRHHPEVFMAAAKEPMFFTYLGEVPPGAALVGDATAELKTLRDYSRLFEDATPEHKAIGEASTTYLCGQLVPTRVRDALPDARLVAILRDPAERAWSRWKVMRRTGVETRSDALSAMKEMEHGRYLPAGMYGAGLVRWLKLFPREQLRVHLLEDLAADANEVMADIFTFIGVQATPVDAATRAFADPENEPIPPALRSWLVDYYSDDIRLLEELLGRDLSRWREA
jgi:Sulfotransferase domain